MARVEDQVEPLLVSFRGAEAMTSFHRSTIERLVKLGTFPQPVQIGESRKGFVKAEIEAWVRARIAGRDAAVAAAQKPARAA